MDIEKRSLEFKNKIKVLPFSFLAFKCISVKTLSANTLETGELKIFKFPSAFFNFIVSTATK